MSCIIIDDEPHAVAELRDLVTMVPHLNLLECFTDVRQGIAFLQEKKHVDVVFSDISMAMLNGLDAAEIYKKYTYFLIYVTAHRIYAPEAFNAKADGYLIKPVSYLALSEKIADVSLKFKDIMQLKKEQQFLFIKGGQKSSFIKIRYNDIVYIEAMLNYVMIHTMEGHEITYLGMKALEEKLEHMEIFFRINKSTIISLNYLERVEGNTVRMPKGQSYQIGEKYKGVFLEFLRKHTLKA